ncbi:MAG: GNAT family N-acetyltransferase [Candidatus Thorarchaeota archaeon]
MKKKWTESEIISSMKKNMIFQVSYFSPYVPAMNIFFNDVFIKCTNIKDDTFNMVLDAHFTDENAKERIDEIIKFFKEKNLPFSWWIGDGDSPSNLQEILISKDFISKEKDYGMYLELKNYFPKNPCKLQIKQVSDIWELKAFDDVHVKSHGNPDAFKIIFKNIPKNAYNGKTPFRMYIGIYNDKVVNTGVLVFNSDVAGIYYIVTDPEERRKGYATDMMNYLLNEAKKENYEIAVLQASEVGKKVYEKIGFKECCVFQEFVLKTHKEI